MKTKRIICLYGGPGSGKSTTCAGLFYKLKLLDYNCEMNREYIKDWVWENREIKGGDQTYIFAKQARKERIYIEQNLDFIITDSPLILTHFYGMKYDSMEQKYNTSLNMLKNHHGFCKDNNYKIDHFFINRVKQYNPAGRNQDEITAKEFDKGIKQLLITNNIKYKEINGDETAVDQILEYMKNEDN